MLFRSMQPVKFTLAIRIPSWVKEQPILTIDGQKIERFKIEDNYLMIEREWMQNEVQLYLPTTLLVSELKGMQNVYAFMEGPIVLAGLIEKEKYIIGDCNHLDTIFQLQQEHTYQVFPWKQSTYKTCNQEENITFIPLYEIANEPYTIYFPMRGK